MDVRVDRLRDFAVPEVGVPLAIGVNVSEKNEAQPHAQEEEKHVRDDALSRAVRVHDFGEEASKRDKEKGRRGRCEHVRQIGRVRQEETARRSARERRRHREKKDRDRAAAGPSERLDERHGTGLLRNFMQKHRRGGEPPERAAHLESPRHDDPVDEAVERTAKDEREGFDASIACVMSLVVVRTAPVGSVTAPGMKQSFKENKKDNDRQSALPHPLRICTRREGFGEEMPERNAQQQPAGKRHKGVAETPAPATLRRRAREGASGSWPKEFQAWSVVGENPGALT